MSCWRNPLPIDPLSRLSYTLDRPLRSGRSWVRWALVCALAVADLGCGFSLGGDGDLGALDVALPTSQSRETSDAADAGPARARSASDAAPLDPADAAPSSDGALPGVPVGMACDAQEVAWTVGGASCSASSGVTLAHGATRVISDSTPDVTGQVTISCSNGALVQSGAACEAPVTFDVGNAAGCVGGYCSAAVGGQCGVADAAKATAICVFKGFAAHTTFATASGPTGVNQCSADGSGCFVNANASCNIVFTSVTCRR